MAVFKCEMRTTFLMEAENLDEAQARITGMEPEYVLREIDDGEFLGQTNIDAVAEVDSAHLEEEETALGGDGTFFSPGE